MTNRYNYFNKEETIGKIIRNGVEFSGTLDNAANVNYNNQNSGMEANTVQEAIDEMSSDLNTLSDSLETKVEQLATGVWAIYNKSMVVLEFYGANVSIGSAGWKTVLTLPENLRPPRLMHGLLADNAASTFATNTVINLAITADGRVDVFLCSDNLSASLVGQMVYLLPN